MANIRFLRLGVLLLFGSMIMSCNSKKKNAEAIESFYSIQSNNTIGSNKAFNNPDEFFNHLDRVSIVNLPLESMLPLDEPHLFKCKDRMIFLDNHHSQLQIVSLDNKLLLKKDLLGRGPGEVFCIKNSFVENDTLYIYDGEKLICYNLDGKYTGVINRKEFEGANKLYKINNTYYAITKYDRNLVKVINEKGKVQSKLLELPNIFMTYRTDNSDDTDYYIKDGSLNFYLHFDFRLFNLSGSNLEAKFQFKKDDLVEFEDIQDVIQEDKSFSNDDYAKLMNINKHLYFNRFIETDNYYLFDLYKSRDVKSYIVNKKDNSLNQLDYLQNDAFLPYLWYMIIFSGSDGDIVYGLVQYSVLKKAISDYSKDPMSVELSKQLKNLYDGNKIQDDDKILLKFEIK